MPVTREMIEAHPSRPPQVEDLVACLDACFACVHACTACADACLHEEAVKDLRRCVRTNLDCADVCAALGKALSRASTPDARLMGSLAQACVDACRACEEDCRMHAAAYAHCRICADACDVCARECQRVLRITPIA